MNYYIALVAMYATAMFGMVILVGLSGQVSLGNGALMAIGGYIFALTIAELADRADPRGADERLVGDGVRRHRRHRLRPAHRWPGCAAQGPYLAGLTLGIAVGIPAIANRFPRSSAARPA